MITDAALQLSSAQAVYGSAPSTNTIDLGNGRDPGRGESITICVTVDMAAAAVAAATVAFQVVASASANLATPNVLAQTGAIPKDELVPGRPQIYLRVSRELLGSVGFGQRYLGLQYLVTNGPLTAGQFTAQVVADEQARVGTLYPQNRVVY